MPEIDDNAMIWGGIVMTTTMKPAVHLGHDDQDNVRTTGVFAEMCVDPVLQAC